MYLQITVRINFKENLNIQWSCEWFRFLGLHISLSFPDKILKFRE
jgi:hypothetical protein